MKSACGIPDHLAKRLAAVQCLSLDVDGVLTDGRINVLPDGEEFASFHAQDGLGIVRLQQAGISVAAISGRDSNPVRCRLLALGVTLLYLGVSDKLSALGALCAEKGVDSAAIAHVGDDLPDLPVFARVGTGIAVSNAVPEVLTAADYVTKRSGGHGAVREVCDLLLAARAASPA